MDFEQEEVPPGKKYMISTRNNSEYKWHARDVVGALEVSSEPELKLRLPLTERVVKKELFERYLKVWKDWKLRDEFIQACENAPKETCCCGLVSDNDATIKKLVEALNDGWIKATNEKLVRHHKNFKLDAYNWNWHNATGKAETNILLIRFFEIPTEQS